MSKSIEEREERERKRREIITTAYDAADRIILQSSDGTIEETNFLTAKVAERMMSRALLPFTAGMARKDLED